MYLCCRIRTFLEHLTSRQTNSSRHQTHFVWLEWGIEAKRFERDKDRRQVDKCRQSLDWFRSRALRQLARPGSNACRSSCTSRFVRLGCTSRAIWRPRDSLSGCSALVVGRSRIVWIRLGFGRGCIRFCRVVCRHSISCSMSHWEMGQFRKNF